MLISLGTSGKVIQVQEKDEKKKEIKQKRDVWDFFFLFLCVSVSIFFVFKQLGTYTYLL